MGRPVLKLNSLRLVVPTKRRIDDAARAAGFATAPHAPHLISPLPELPRTSPKRPPRLSPSRTLCPSGRVFLQSVCLRSLELRVNCPQPRPVYLVHVLGERPLGRLEFGLERNRSPVPLHDMQEAGFGFFPRRIRTGETVASRRRPAFQPLCYIRQIPRDQMVPQRVPVKRRMEGGYIYDFIA